MMKTYRFTLYHDEPENAATDSRGSDLPGYRSRRSATLAAQSAMGGYWNGGATIEIGTFVPGRLGVRPDGWDFEETVAWLGPRN